MKTLLLVILLVCCGWDLHAGDAGSVSLKQASLGTYLSGPKLKSADLAGRIVLFEYWGINCGPCIANIPHVSELAALADPERLVVIANQCQEPGKTMSVWKSSGGTNRPTVIDGGELPGSNVNGIPRCFLFDHTGKLVYDGHPGMVTVAQIKTLLAAAPGPLVKPGTYKTCASEANALTRSDQSIRSTLSSLRSKAAKGAPDTQAEATALLAGVKDYLDQQWQMIETNRTADPILATTILQRCLTLVRGDDGFGQPFEALFKELKQDKTFQNELSAALILDQVKTVADKINLDENRDAALKRSEFQQVLEGLRTLLRKHPTTKAGQEAERLRTKWKLG